MTIQLSHCPRLRANISAKACRANQRTAETAAERILHWDVHATRIRSLLPKLTDGQILCLQACGECGLAVHQSTLQRAGNRIKPLLRNCIDKLYEKASVYITPKTVGRTAYMREYRRRTGRGKGAWTWQEHLTK